MLAPLEDRRVLATDDREIDDLRKALRASRLRLRRSALQSTRQIAALNAELTRLQQICERQAHQIARYAAGAVIVDLGRRLMTLSEANERLREDARRAVMLERVLGLTDAERRRLSHERDALAAELCRQRHAALLGTAGWTGDAHADASL